MFGEPSTTYSYADYRPYPLFRAKMSDDALLHYDPLAAALVLYN